MGENSWQMSRPVRAAFFDADGTLLSFATHSVPASAVQALEGLRAAGVRTFLCTGRAPYMLDDLPLDLFDALITFSGSYCLQDDEVFYACPLDRDDLATVVGQVRAGLYECYFMEGRRSYASAHNELVCGAERDAKLVIPEGDIGQALTGEVFQLNVFLPPGGERLVDEATRHMKFARWSPNFADVLPDACGKDVAVGRVLERFGLEADESICFGDGGNDVDMFGAVGTSVAMGNAREAVQAAATYVTDAVDEGGIWNACVRLGLLSD